MPTYEYRCEQCTHQFEVFARMSDPDPEACEACAGGPLVKVLFPVAVHYKGSGFYSTDYNGKRTAAAGDAAASAAGDSAAASGGTASEGSGLSSDSASTGTSSSTTPASGASSAAD